jgi:hypothetical protein
LDGSLCAGVPAASNVNIPASRPHRALVMLFICSSHLVVWMVRNYSALIAGMWQSNGVGTIVCDTTEFDRLGRAQLAGTFGCQAVRAAPAQPGSRWNSEIDTRNRGISMAVARLHLQGGITSWHRCVGGSRVRCHYAC